MLSIVHHQVLLPLLTRNGVFLITDQLLVVQVSILFRFICSFYVLMIIVEEIHHPLMDNMRQLSMRGSLITNPASGLQPLASPSKPLVTYAKNQQQNTYLNEEAELDREEEAARELKARRRATTAKAQAPDSNYKMKR